MGILFGGFGVVAYFRLTKKEFTELLLKDNDTLRAENAKLLTEVKSLREEAANATPILRLSETVRKLSDAVAEAQLGLQAAHLKIDEMELVQEQLTERNTELEGMNAKWRHSHETAQRELTHVQSLLDDAQRDIIYICELAKLPDTEQILAKWKNLSTP